MGHPRSACNHAQVGDKPSQVVCAIGNCLANAHVGVCLHCDCYDGPANRAPRYFKIGTGIAHLTRATGIEAMARRRAKRLGIPCGCDKRREQLDHLIPNPF